MSTMKRVSFRHIFRHNYRFQKRLFLVDIRKKILTYVYCVISERKRIEHNAILITALKLVYDSYEKPGWLRDAFYKRGARYSYS